MGNTKNLGEEKIPKLLLKFSLPCIAGMLINAFYSIVDQIFIGNSSLGYLGNAATGVSFPVVCIANAVAWSIGDAAAALLSICTGAKDRKGANECVATGLTSTFIISMVLMVICLIFNRPLMDAFGASAETLDLAVEYFAIIAGFFPIYVLANVMSATIRADGHPGFAMLSVIMGAIINIALDPLFIFVFDWGMTGAAAATGIGQFISFAICVVYFFHPKNFDFNRKSFHINWKTLRKLCTLGGATFITQISVVLISLVSNIMLTKFGGLSVYGEDIPLAAFSIQTKAYTIVTSFVIGMSLGGQPILGYNLGAGKEDRVKHTFVLMLCMSVVFGLLATIMFEVCPQFIVGLFGDGQESGNAELYREFAVKMFRIFLSLTCITCIGKTTALFFQSTGKSVQAMIASLVRDILCFIPLTFILSNWFESVRPGSGVFGILFAAPIADFVSGIIIATLIIRFFVSEKKKKNAVLQDIEKSSESASRD